MLGRLLARNQWWGWPKGRRTPKGGSDLGKPALGLQGDRDVLRSKAYIIRGLCTCMSLDALLCLRPSSWLYDRNDKQGAVGRHLLTFQTVFIVGPFVASTAHSGLAVSGEESEI